MTNRDKFIRWYVRPYNRLKRIPDGDGAFAALSIGFFLCERYYRIKTNTITQHRKTERFLKAAARDFDCNYQVFRTFWYLFRNGIQHQGAPKKSFVDHSNPLKPTIRMRWALSDWFSHRPGYLVMDNKKRVGVCPWKFTRFMLCKFLSNERALERSTSHSFGSILEAPQTMRKIELPFR